MEAIWPNDEGVVTGESSFLQAPSCRICVKPTELFLCLSIRPLSDKGGNSQITTSSGRGVTVILSTLYDHGGTGTLRN